MTSQHRHGTGKTAAAGDVDARIAALTARLVSVEARTLVHDDEIAALEAQAHVHDVIPPPPPPAWTWPTLQAAIDATPAGGTLDATGRTFNERVRIARVMTLVGGTVDGVGLGVPLQQGVLTVAASDVVLRGVRATGSDGAGLDISRVSRVSVIGCTMDGNRQEGYHVTGAADLLFEGCTISGNNAAMSVDPLWEAGGGKATNSQRLTFRDCTVSGNGGPGIWFDINGDDVVVEGCTVHHNTHAGIMFEISRGARISGNALWENGWRDGRGWGWPSSILVSTATDAVVEGNDVAWSPVGIAVVSQRRADYTAAQTGNRVTGNRVAASTGRTPVGYYVDWPNPSPAPVTSPNATATTADLAAAGIPTAPEPGH